MPRDRTFVTGTLAAVRRRDACSGCSARSPGSAPRTASRASRSSPGGRCSASCSWARCSSRAAASASRSRRSEPCRAADAWRSLLASCMGLTLNLAMFSAFGLIPIALALMLFYTYPAGVVVVDVAMGHERITPRGSRRSACRRSAWCSSSSAGFDPAAAAPIQPLGVVLGLTAAAAQVVFVTVSRHGYRSVPADGATLINIGVSLVGRDGRRASRRPGRRPGDAVALARPVAGAAARRHRGGGDVVAPVPDGDPAHRRHADGDPDAPRAGRRGRARGAVAGRGPRFRSRWPAGRSCSSARSSSRCAATRGTTRSSSRPPARSSRRRTGRRRPGPPPTPRG